jgi:tetratricopeptide (TPR) repeat protein
MFELKRLSTTGIPAAIAKAERYRLLNEPGEAESICLDILEVDPENREVLVMLLLSLTDQFAEGRRDGVAEARALVPRLADEYDRAYYSGIIAERLGKTRLHAQAPGASSMAYELFKEAMSWYEKAEAIRPPGNDDPILRWNTCARILMRTPGLGPAGEEWVEPYLE